MNRFLLCLLIAASIVHPLLLAQQKPNPQLVEAARQRAARMGDIVMGQEVTSQISTYEKKENTNSYELTTKKREGKNVMVRDSKEMKLPLEEFTLSLFNLNEFVHID
jgi:Ni/Co efflux regulator RcnB